MAGAPTPAEETIPDLQGAHGSSAATANGFFFLANAEDKTDFKGWYFCGTCRNQAKL